MIIRNAVLSDLDEIILIHKDSFPKGIQTYMGDEYLRRRYRFLIRYSEIKLVSEFDSEVIGFNFSTPKETYKLKNSFYDYVLILLSLLKNSFKTIHILYGRLLLFFGTSSIIKNNFNSEISDIELGYIAISKLRRSTGAGSRLISEFEKIAKKKYNYDSIITRTHNQRLTNFYVSKKKAIIQNQKAINNNYLCTLIWKIK